MPNTPAGCSSQDLYDNAVGMLIPALPQLYSLLLYLVLVHPALLGCGRVKTKPGSASCDSLSPRACGMLLAKHPHISVDGRLILHVNINVVL